MIVVVDECLRRLDADTDSYRVHETESIDSRSSPCAPDFGLPSMGHRGWWLTR